MNLARKLRRRGAAHLDERRIVALADDPSVSAAWPARDREHLQDCSRCHDLLVRHQRLAASLNGSWDITELAGVDRTRYTAPGARGRLIAASLVVIAAMAGTAALAGSMLIGSGSGPRLSPGTTIVVVKGVLPSDETSIGVCDRTIGQYGEAHPDEWGGFWVSTDGFLVATFTGHVEDHARDLRAYVPASCPTVVEQVTYTYAQLTVLQTSLSADWSKLQSLGAKQMGTFVDAKVNRLHVDIAPLTPEIRAEVLAGRPADMLDLGDGAQGPLGQPAASTP